jgi:probable HAF family extracellular repeat protein
MVMRIAFVVVVLVSGLSWVSSASGETAAAGVGRSQCSFAGADTASFQWLIPAAQRIACLSGGEDIPAAARVAPSPWATDLGDLGGNSYAYEVNERGLVAGSSQLDPYDYERQHAFWWTRSAGMVDIGTAQPTDFWSFPRALNDRGQVVGEVEGRAMRAFSWTHAGGLVDLGTHGAHHSDALDINSHGLIVGLNEIGYFETYHALAWTPGGAVIDLGTLPGDDTSQADAVNDHGVVVGQSSGSIISQAFSWTQAEGMMGLGTLGGHYSWAGGVNNHGWIVGQSLTRGDQHVHGFVWTRRGGMRDIGTLGGRESYTLDINEHGQVVGGSTTGVGRSEHAFSWTRRGGMDDLGTLGGRNSYASDVNDRGQVVGVSETSARGFRAFLWTPKGGMIDLGTLGGASSGANAINDHGQIVGYAETDSGDFHAVLWTLPRKLR